MVALWPDAAVSPTISARNKTLILRASGNHIGWMQAQQSSCIQPLSHKILPFPIHSTPVLPLPYQSIATIKITHHKHKTHHIHCFSVFFIQSHATHSTGNCATHKHTLKHKSKTWEPVSREYRPYLEYPHTGNTAARQHPSHVHHRRA